MAKVWFVTGTSSGIGQALVEEVLRKGDKAVVLLPAPSAISELLQKYSSSQLLVFKCDVTNQKEIDKAFSEALKAFKKIDVVINNPGFAFIREADSEGSKEKDAHKMLEVNFLAASYIGREAIRIFKEGGSGGKLINISSIAGISADPILLFYSASNFTIEGLTESLRKEIDPKSNITVTLLEFGGVKTRQYKL